MMCSRVSTLRPRPRLLPCLLSCLLQLPRHQRPLLASKRRTGGFGFAFCLIAAFCQGGCGRPGSIPAVWGRSHTGHVYTARLLPEHPLYPQYQRLGQEIAALRDPRVLSATPPVFMALGELFLPAPEPPAFPLSAFGERERTWRLALLPDRPVSQPELDPDLAAEVNWARNQAQQAADSQLTRVLSEQESRLAEVRAKAVRARQEAFNNAGLDLTVPEREVEAPADRERQRLWAQLEEELKTARAEAEAQVATACKAIAEGFEADVAAATEQARQRMKRRAEIFAKSGSEMRSRMSKSMAPPEPLPPTPGLQWRPKVPKPDGMGVANAASALDQRDRRVRSAQASLLADKRAEIAAQMEEGTERAVRRLAGVQGIRVSFPPAESAIGKDLTDEVRPALRSMYQH